MVRNNKQLSIDDKAKILILKTKGNSNRKIAGIMKCNESSVRRFLNKYEKTKNIRRKVGSGRKRCTSERTDSRIKELVLRNRFVTAVEIKRDLEDTLEKRISVSTINRRLNEMGLCAQAPAKKPFLTRQMRKKRLEWAKERKNWTLTDWKKVIFSDESKFNLIGSDGRMRVRRRKSERLNPNCLLPTVKHSPYIMVWGSITSQGVGELIILVGPINASAYKEIIDNGVIPTIERLSETEERILFQDDSAPCHRAKSVKEYKEYLGIESITWPGNSPDLNLIEHVWHFIGRKISQRKPKTIAEMKNVIENMWYNEINLNFLNNLFESMPKRINEVIKIKGGNTKY